jgi:DNA-binding transcriptional regulator YhcF (GntR family)
MSPSDLAVAAGAKLNNVKQLLFKMSKAGEVTKLKGRGRYIHPSRTDLLETDNFDNPVTANEEDENG